MAGQSCETLENGTVVNCQDVVVSYISMYFLFIGMALGAFSLWAQMKFLPWFPYTAILFIEGIILGVIHKGTDEGLGELSLSMQSWVEIDPFLLMAVFLPALIFADAMKINIHQFQTMALWPSLLLAVPGVMFNAVIMSTVAKFALGYDWDWYACFMFGSVLAATDPVAVVALVESTNLPTRLSLLMSSESHLADLTVLVLFKFFLDIITQGGQVVESAGSATKFFATMLLIGPLVGLVFGFAANYLIRMSVSPTRSSDTMVQISVTVFCAYLSFLVSEHNFHSNGILATVVCGLVIAAYSWPKFAKRETMEHVWSAIEYFGNTMIFLLAGVIIGSNFQESLKTDLSGLDALNVFIVWGFLFGSRFLIVFLGYPFLYLASKKQLRPLEAVTLVFGGIRGAVTITLAIVVLNTAEAGLYDEELTNHFGPNYKSALRKFFFLVGSVTLLTLVVNYSFFPMLCRVLKVSSHSKSKKRLHDHVRKRVAENAATIFHEIKAHDPGYEEISIDEVRDYIQTARRGRRSVGSMVNEKEIKRSGTNLNIDPDSVEIDECDVRFLRQVRLMFLNAVRAQYWEQINQGKLPRKSKAALDLLNSVDIAMDSVNDKLDDLEPLGLFERLDHVSCMEKLFSSMDSCLPESVTIDNYLFYRIKNGRREETIYLATAFIEAHIQAEKRIAEFVGEDETIDTPEEAYVIKESRSLREKAEEFLKLATEDDADVVHQVHILKMTSAIIEKQRLFIEDLADQGLIDEKFLEEQMDTIREDQIKLEKQRRLRFQHLAARRASVSNRRLDVDDDDVETDEAKNKSTVAPAEP